MTSEAAMSAADDIINQCNHNLRLQACATRLRITNEYIADIIQRAIDEEIETLVERYRDQQRGTR